MRRPVCKYCGSRMETVGGLGRGGPGKRRRLRKRVASVAREEVVPSEEVRCRF